VRKESKGVPVRDTSGEGGDLKSNKRHDTGVLKLRPEHSDAKQKRETSSRKTQRPGVDSPKQEQNNKKKEKKRDNRKGRKPCGKEGSNLRVEMSKRAKTKEERNNP